MVEDRGLLAAELLVGRLFRGVRRWRMGGIGWVAALLMETGGACCWLRAGVTVVLAWTLESGISVGRRWKNGPSSSEPAAPRPSARMFVAGAVAARLASRARLGN